MYLRLNVSGLWFINAARSRHRENVRARILHPNLSGVTILGLYLCANLK